MAIIIINNNIKNILRIGLLIFQLALFLRVRRHLSKQLIPQQAYSSSPNLVPLIQLS